MIIHKSHSKQDLLDIVNTLNLKITIGHGDNKSNIQDKYYDYFKNENNVNYEDNVYSINDKRHLQIYLKNETPKKVLNVKDKKVVMSICKEIIKYCNNNYWLAYTKYDTEKELEDDMLFIIQYGDLPSVRRCCKLMNENVMSTTKYEPIISPQIKKELDDKNKSKLKNRYFCKFLKGPITIRFD